MFAFFKKIDWLLLFFVLPISIGGLLTMKSFIPVDGQPDFFSRQIIWLCVSLVAFFIFAYIDFRFLKRSDILFLLFLSSCFVLLLLFVFGSTAKGATSWFSFGGFSFQPVDVMKLVVVLMLAKYFSRRHVEIKNIKHVLISGLYAFIPFVLVFLQPDFGSAMIIFFIWLGMVLVSGISKRHLLVIGGVCVLTFFVLWTSVFAPYQKARIVTFFNPLSDIRGTGYNAYQSTVAVGSGEIVGKGLGFGTQSRLRFLPEYQTDFIFASFSEEWGFVGSFVIMLLFVLLFWRILQIALTASSNFEMLFGIGLAIYFMSHIVINIGMNLGIMPVTGIPLPFMSYGGSHLLTEFIALGILMNMRNYSRAIHRDDVKNEFLGI
jgi:rod shape determining protein RodA